MRGKEEPTGQLLSLVICIAGQRKCKRPQEAGGLHALGQNVKRLQDDWNQPRYSLFSTLSLTRFFTSLLLF